MNNINGFYNLQRIVIRYNAKLMKVCLINTADHGGGAAVAAKRLLRALKKTIDVKLLVQDKKSPSTSIISTIKYKAHYWISQYNFLRERLSFIALYEKNKKVRFAFSTAITGVDIAHHKLIDDADLLHLHWINHGFLSLQNLSKLFSLDKPIVWTLHDMWPFTGGCHYTSSCENFVLQCGNCLYLKNPHPNDISHIGHKKKQKLFSEKSDILFVACSEWMANYAKKSSLLKNHKIIHIPNAIDTNLYQPLETSILKRNWEVSADAKIILFGAANINDQRKGIKYLIEALHLMKSKYPLHKSVEIILFGKNKTLDCSTLPFPAVDLSIISSQQDLIELYNIADVFILPSLQDNLPNMVMEAMSCGTPVVAFNQGGTPEMIDHKINGYLAKFESSEDLAEGIFWSLFQTDLNIKYNARKKVLDNYAEPIIAEAYLKAYKSLL